MARKWTHAEGQGTVALESAAHDAEREGNQGNTRTDEVNQQSELEHTHGAE